MTEELAMTGDWDKDFPEEGQQKSDAPKKDYPKAELVTFKKPGKYIVRLVGKYIYYRNWFSPYKARSKDNLKDQDPAWKAGFYPQKKYAINVIDRSDGKLKILDKGRTIFEEFKTYKELHDVDPAGKDGPDFAIVVKIPKDSDGKYIYRETSYSVQPIGKAPLTAEEKKMICKVDDDGNIKKDENGKPVSNLWPLEKIFKPTPIEKMQEMWDALSDEQKTPPKRKDKEENKPEGTISEEPIAEPEPKEEPEAASDDALFEGGAGEEGSADLF